MQLWSMGRLAPFISFLLKNIDLLYIWTFWPLEIHTYQSIPFPALTLKLPRCSETSYLSKSKCHFCRHVGLPRTNMAIWQYQTDCCVHFHLSWMAFDFVLITFEYQWQILTHERFSLLCGRILITFILPEMPRYVSETIN